MKTAFFRFGAFMIDMSIINMFSRILYMYILAPYIHLTHNIFLNFVAGVTSILIIIFMGVLYQYICFRLIHNSLGKELLRLRYVREDNKPITVNQLLRREFLKYYMLYATILLYIPYGFYVTHVRQEQMYHEKKSGLYTVQR